ncbi:VOC family protein [Streptomyces sp. NPDC006879]|uniref:VOC family protein n=1 Tax=Streptomyces sp. NPDC006879 TaxID=3364767 RepID=UPI00367B862E
MLGTDFVTGSPNWIDLGSPDPQRAADFYKVVFGWDFQEMGPDAEGYGLLKQDGRTTGAIGKLTEEGATSAWTVYFHTPDADATTVATSEHGGTVRVQPFDVMDAGRMACLTDPGGAEFAVWQPASMKGLEVASEDNTLLWAELHVRDTARALAFYRELFGWRSEEMPVPGMTYTVLSTAEGDQQQASFGGIAPITSGPLQEEMDPRWIPYFAVAETDASVALAEAAGGEVLVPATDLADVGRMAWLADPFGAPFAVLKPAPRAGAA